MDYDAEEAALKASTVPATRGFVHTLLMGAIENTVTAINDTRDGYKKRIAELATKVADRDHQLTRHSEHLARLETRLAAAERKLEGK
jgi:phosphate uptake regulator